MSPHREMHQGNRQRHMKHKHGPVSHVRRLGPVRVDNRNNFQKETVAGAGEAAWLVESLLYKHEDLHLIPTDLVAWVDSS